MTLAQSLDLKVYLLFRSCPKQEVAKFSEAPFVRSLMAKSSRPQPPSMTQALSKLSKKSLENGLMPRKLLKLNNDCVRFILKI